MDENGESCKMEKKYDGIYLVPNTKLALILLHKRGDRSFLH